MKALGMILSVFGGLLVFSALNLLRIGKFNLSTTEGIQQFVGAAACGTILLGLGLKLVTSKRDSSK
jgi:hypothetical protein